MRPSGRLGIERRCRFRGARGSKVCWWRALTGGDLGWRKVVQLPHTRNVVQRCRQVRSMDPSRVAAAIISSNSWRSVEQSLKVRLNRPRCATYSFSPAKSEPNRRRWNSRSCCGKRRWVEKPLMKLRDYTPMIRALPSQAAIWVGLLPVCLSNSKTDAQKRNRRHRHCSN